MTASYRETPNASALQGPLVRHLREIADGRRPFPTTPARRHHFVPSFSLARFATPRKRDGLLFQLDTSTGKPGKTTPDESAFVEELYSQETEVGQDRRLEAYFAVVENYAAQAFGRFLERPLDLTAQDRQTISYYLAFQYQRTPVVIEHSMANSQATMELMMSVHFSDAKAFRENYREKVDATATDDEIESLRKRTRAALQNGEVAFSNPKGQAFRLMLGSADDLAQVIFRLNWVLLRASEDDFITSDRAIAMHDPTPKFPWSGHALESSPSAETTFPLDPEYTLLLHRGSTRIATADVARQAVCELNLRTYGWATGFIFGQSQAAVQRVRRQAKRRPDQVIEPRTPKPVLLEPADRDDPTVGAENVARGWPRGVMIPGEEGGRQFAAYTVVDPNARGAGAAAASGDAAARRVMRRPRKS